MDIELADHLSTFEAQAGGFQFTFNTSVFDNQVKAKHGL